VPVLDDSVNAAGPAKVYRGTLLKLIVPTAAGLSSVTVLSEYRLSRKSATASWPFGDCGTGTI
jgi:hypothetical protein